MTDSIPKKPLKKGSLVVVDKESYIKSIAALASDIDLPNYVFEGPGQNSEHPHRHRKSGDAHQQHAG